MNKKSRLKSALWTDYSIEIKDVWEALYEMRDNQLDGQSTSAFVKQSNLAQKLLDALYELQSALAAVQLLLWFIVGGIVGHFFFGKIMTAFSMIWSHI